MADENLLSRSRSAAASRPRVTPGYKTEPHSNFEQTQEFFAQTTHFQDRYRTSTARYAPQYIFIVCQNHVPVMQARDRSIARTWGK